MVSVRRDRCAVEACLGGVFGHAFLQNFQDLQPATAAL
jgi:hypothetical protein